MIRKAQVFVTVLPTLICMVLWRNIFFLKYIPLKSRLSNLHRLVPLPHEVEVVHRLGQVQVPNTIRPKKYQFNNIRPKQ